MAKKIDPKAKAKKQKIYAAVGGVLLLGLLAFQVPRTMKMLHPPNVDSAATTAPASTTPTSGPIAAPSLSGGNATAVSASGGPEGSSTPTRYRSRSPGSCLLSASFAPRTPSCSSSSCSAARPAPKAVSRARRPRRLPALRPRRRQPPARRTAFATGTAPPTAAVLTTAVILVNGKSESVQVGAQFPATDPAFTLVSVTAATAKVGIAGGSFENGSQTVKLTKNKPLTLMNTADGTRYVLRLVSISLARGDLNLSKHTFGVAHALPIRVAP